MTLRTEEIAKAWHDRGNLLIKMGYYEEAIFCFNKVIEIDIDSDFEHVQFLKKEAQLKQKQWKGVCHSRLLVKTHEITQKKPEENMTTETEIEEFYQKGLREASKGYHQTAIFFFLRVLEIDCKNVKAIFGIGIAYEDLEEFDKSIKFYTKTLDINPHHEAARYGRTRLIKKLQEENWEPIDCM